MKNKEDKYRIIAEECSNRCDRYLSAMIVEFVVIILLIIVFSLSINVINDLKTTANDYESDRNICRGQLDSLTQELERMQNDYNG